MSIYASYLEVESRLMASSALLTFSIARNVGVLAILGLAVLTQDTQEDTQKYLSLSWASHERDTNSRVSFNGLEASYSPDASDRFPSQHALQIPLPQKTELKRRSS